MPESCADFDYSFLVNACRQIKEATRHGSTTSLAIVSTVLPGTLRREVVPILGSELRLVYNPQFIAMGTTIHDFLHPEFVLLGSDSPTETEQLERITAFYETITSAPRAVMGLESAELTKVAYNVFVGMKIAFANYLGEFAEATGAHIDDVTDALALATRRVVSPAYLRAGMGDGGGCHPRDLIALSWASERYRLSYDLPRRIMKAREAQSCRLATLVARIARDAGLPIVILGKAYKPGTNLTLGSPAILLANHLTKEATFRMTTVDPFLDADWERALLNPSVFVVATDHAHFHSASYARGSIVIDPWGHARVPAGAELITPGRRRRDSRS
jgi:UDPglucose 6-dehydrogenase